jgi:hypothetical protein
LFDCVVSVCTMFGGSWLDASGPMCVWCVLLLALLFPFASFSESTSFL